MEDLEEMMVVETKEVPVVHKVVTVDLEEHKVEMVVAMTLITVAKASVCQRFRAAL